jgi:hypothetical protein
MDVSNSWVNVNNSTERAALLRSWTVNAEAWATAVREQAIPSRRVATDAAIIAACARVLDGGADYACVSYEALESNAAVLAGPFDLIVCNFALLDDRVASLLTALARRLPASGVILVQTVHPWAAVGDGAYEDGWRTETWGAFDKAFPAPMPWYFRTTSSWLAAVREARLVVDRLEEPIHPESRKPLSLILELG